MPGIHTRKLNFYLKHILADLSPRRFYLSKGRMLMNEMLRNDTKLLNRANYYCKIQEHFTPCQKNSTLDLLSVLKEPSAPCYDLKSYLRYFPSNLRFDYNFLDLFDIPYGPTFVKNRPISKSNSRYVLMKLNSGRFFDFTRDKLRFEKKGNIAIFRGPCHRPHRKYFIKKCFEINNTDIGDTRPIQKSGKYHKSFMPVDELLKNKFIISVEGSDVSSSLPWIMASNSLAFMTEPIFEGWFMQGKLIPNYHYVLLKDDYSDLEEKIDYYSSNELDALEIINNAHKHVAQFFDHKSELITSLLVLEKYFKLSNQI
jgi:hypothetical protein